ncbi:MAG: glutamate-1-semialdehyde-2,1-aminomutase [Candidatus Marinimicrobia bacterium]|nr:glutamate-1-semialdehyde-2,1-aminomutase [Candidatus Neomarinimicrobiota bacterium]|tara:strand:+ start:7571 stop:8860 length:1290 start_codon:yes stop_codon:yes gene_type:complete
MKIKKQQSEQLYEIAKKLMPGGVNSPVRSFKSVGGIPHFIKKGNGPFIYDEDGNEFLDFTGSWGPLILGHSNPKIISAIKEALDDGTTFGAPTKKENILAQLVIDAVPSIEKVRFVNSGTEATMSAVRLARGYTNRDIIIKFEGCYHGHADFFLSKAGSGLATLGQPSSPGIPKAVVESTITVNFNDINAVEKIFENNPNKIAAVILEPICGNMGVVKPKSDFLKDLRKLCNRYGSILIFDEVMTGFRVSYGGAQELLNVIPDLTTLGKIIGGGLPVGAYGGKKEIMSKIAPEGSIYQAGTLSGNPIAMAGGISTLMELKSKGFYDSLEKSVKYLSNGFREIAKEHKIPLIVNQYGSMVGLFFTNLEVNNFEDVLNTKIDIYNSMHGYFLNNNIYLPPSAYEAFFISNSHKINHFDKVLKIFKEFCKSI